MGGEHGVRPARQVVSGPRHVRGDDQGWQEGEQHGGSKEERLAWN